MPKAKPAVALERLERKIQEQRELYEAADTLLLTTAMEGRDRFEPDEARILEAVGIETVHEQRSRLDSYRSIVRLQREAGTVAQRKKAAAAVATAEAALADRGPAIREELAKLGAELDQLTGTVDDTRAVVAAYEKAGENLRRMVPEWVKRDVESRRCKVRDGFRDEIGDLELRADLYRKVLVFAEGPATRWADVVRRAIQRMQSGDPGPWSVFVENGWLQEYGHIVHDLRASNVSPDAHEAMGEIVQVAQEQLPTVADQLAKARAAMAAEMAECEAELDMYLLP